jgi:acylphosphatase
VTTRRLAWLLAAGLLGPAIAAAPADDKKDDEKRKGTVTGVVTAKGDAWIEVKADGEEKARRYVPHWRGGNPDQGGGPDKAMLARIKEVPLKSRVRLEWVFEERPRVEKIEVLGKGKGEEARKGSVTGVVTARGEDWVEVKADGEEKARRYVPHFPGRPEGTDKATLELMRTIPVGSRVKLDWLFEERPRVMKIEVLKKGDGHGHDAPDAKEKRSGTISGEVKAKKEQNNNVVIEVLAPGEEKPRPYFVQYDPKIKGPLPEVLKAVRAAKIGDRVVFDWEATGHGPAIVKFEVLKKK